MFLYHMIEEYSSIIFCSYSEKNSDFYYYILLKSRISTPGFSFFILDCILYVCWFPFFNIIIWYNVYIDKDIYKHIDAYFTMHQFKLFKNSIWRLIFSVLFFIKYALINIRSHNQYTYSIDLLSIRISIRIISISISKHRDQQAKG